MNAILVCQQSLYFCNFFALKDLFKVRVLRGGRVLPTLEEITEKERVEFVISL